MKLQLIKVNDPFRRANREISVVDYEPNQSLQHIRNSYFPQDVKVVVSINGKIIPDEFISTTFPADGDNILFVPDICGGDGKNIIRALMMIAVAVAAPYAAAAMGFVTTAGMLTTTGIIVAGAIAVTGGIVINMLMPPILPEMPTMDLTGSQVYSWAQQTIQQQGGPVPKFYGTNKCYGNIIMAYTQWDVEQYAFIIIGLGLGPWESIREVKINDQPAENFKEVEIQTRLGDMDQSIIDEVGDTEIEYPQDILVEHGEPVLYTTEDRDDFDQINVELGYKKGIFRIDDDGDIRHTKVDMRISIRKVGDIDWTVISRQAKSTTTVVGPYWSLGESVVNKSGGYVWYENDRDLTSGKDATGKNGEVQDGYRVYTWRWFEKNTTYTIALDADIEYIRTTNTHRTYPLYFNNFQRIPDNKKGVHDIKIERLTADHENSSEYSDELSFTSLDQIYFDKFTYPRNVLVGIKALATDQLSGSLRFSCIAKCAKVRVCTNANPGQETWVVQWTDNPAWVAWDILTQPVFDNNLNVIRWDGTDPTTTPKRFDLAKWKEWADFCDGIVYDGKTKYLTAAGSDTTHIVLQSGGSSFSADNGGDYVLIDPTGGTQYQGKDDTSQVPRVTAVDGNTLTIAPALTQAPASGIEVKKGEKRVTFNGAFDVTTSVWDAVLRVCQVGRAVPVWNGTQLTLAINKKTTPVQMFTIGNIGEDSFEESFLSVEDRASEIKVEFVNLEKDYDRDRLLIYNNNLPNSTNKITLELFGITKPSEAWRAGMLKLYINQYIIRSLQHTADIDSIATTIGDCVNIQHDIPQWGEGGRVVSATANTVTLDKSVTLEAGKSYILLVRLSDDTIVQKSVTNTPGTYTVLSVSPNYTAIPLQYDVYAFGEITKAVKPFLITNLTRGQDQDCTLEMVEYNETIYDKVDYDDPPIIADIDYSALDPIPKVINLTLTELSEIDESGNVRRSIEVFYELPDNSVIKATKIYYKIVTPGSGTPGSLSQEWIYSPTSIISPVEPLTTYDVVVVSVNLFGVESPISDSPTETITTSATTNAAYGQLKVGITGLQLFGQANDNEFGGRDAKFIWNAVNPVNVNPQAGFELFGAGSGKPVPWFKDYVIEIWDIINNKPKLPRRTEFTPINLYIYSFEKNYEDGLLRNYDIKVWARDRFGRISEKPAILTVTNPAPFMLDSAGNTITPTTDKIKSGLEIGWTHPYRADSKGEYDVSHFLLKIAEAYDANDPNGSDGISLFNSEKWQPSTAYGVGDLIYPPTLNGHAYKCIVAGVSGASAPSFPLPSIITPHPTVTDGTITWRHNALFRLKKVASLVSIDSADDDIATASYTATVKGLDPKKQYITQVVPYDVYGRGSPSAIATARPGTTEDDAEDAILVPSQVSAGSFELRNGNNLKYTWPILLDSIGVPVVDIKRYIVEWRAVANTAATEPPTSVEVEQGYLESDNTIKCTGQTIQVDTDGEVSNKNWVIIQDAKVGYKYFARTRAENTSGQKGAWSVWATHTAVIQGITADDLAFEFKQFIFTGDFTSAGQQRINWSSGTLKFKKTDGTFTSYSISFGGSVGNVTQECWIIWKESAPTVFSITTDPFTATNAGVVTMAHCLPGATANDYAIYNRFSSKNDFVVNASVITAGSVDTAALRALAVKANKMDIDGPLTMLYNSSAKLVFKDGAGNSRIALSVFNSGGNTTPYIRISRPGYNADEETDPNKLFFDSTYNYLKILAQGEFSFTTTHFPAGTQGANSGQIRTITYADIAALENVSGTTTKKFLVANIYFDTGNLEASLPFVCPNSSTSVADHWALYYDSANDDLIMKRFTLNVSGVGASYSQESGKVKWCLMAETVS